MATGSTSPNEIDTLNFEEVDIRWTVRRSSGERVRFVQLSALQEALDAGEVTPGDELTFDGTVWRRLSDIPDLRAYFWQVWKRAQRGELQADWMPTIGGAYASSLGEDAPTTIAPPDSALSQAIQEVLARELHARSQEKLAQQAPPPQPAAPHPPPPLPSEIPGILRAMVVSLSLVVVALLILLSMA